MIRIAMEAAKAAFFAAPLVWKLGLIAAGATALGGSFLYWRHSIYQAGYDEAISDIAEANAAKAKEVREAISKVRDCRDSGGAWDQSRGMCIR